MNKNEQQIIKSLKILEGLAIKGKFKKGITPLGYSVVLNEELHELRSTSEFDKLFTLLNNEDVKFNVLLHYRTPIGLIHENIRIPIDTRNSSIGPCEIKCGRTLFLEEVISSEDVNEVFKTLYYKGFKFNPILNNNGYIIGIVL